MGPETEPTGALYFSDGTKFCNLAEIPEFKPITNSEDDYLMGIDFPEVASFIGQLCVLTPKYLRCHSRKRFIKLLMSKGYDKRTATALAILWWLTGIPYQTAWSWEAFSC